MASAGEPRPLTALNGGVVPRYVGERSGSPSRVVAVTERETRPLVARREDPLRSFSWGHCGPGSRALAWALICDATGDEQLADDWYRDLAVELVSWLPRESFDLDGEVVLAWLRSSPGEPLGWGPAVGVGLVRRSRRVVAAPRAGIAAAQVRSCIAAGTDCP